MLGLVKLLLQLLPGELGSLSGLESGLELAEGLGGVHIAGGHIPDLLRHLHF